MHRRRWRRRRRQTRGRSLVPVFAAACRCVGLAAGSPRQRDVRQNQEGRTLAAHEERSIRSSPEQEQGDNSWQLVLRSGVGGSVRCWRGGRADPLEEGPMLNEAKGTLSRVSDRSQLHIQPRFHTVPHHLPNRKQTIDWSRYTINLIGRRSSVGIHSSTGNTRAH